MKQILIILVLSTYSCLFGQMENWKSYPDSTIWSFYNESEITVEKIVERGGGKSVLLFYFEASSIHVNHMNRYVLYDPEVVKFMTDNFFLLAIGLDVHPQYEKAYRKFLTDQTFYIQTTPAFSIYNPEGILRGSKPFNNAKPETKQEFLDFLKKRLN